MLDRASIELLLASVLAGLTLKLAPLDALILPIKVGRAFNPLSLAFEILRTFLPLDLTFDALLLAFELRRAVLALDLAFNALRSLEALPFLALNLALNLLWTVLALDLTFDALLLAFEALRTLGSLNLLPFHALRLLEALHLLTFGALRAFGALGLFAAAPGRLGLRRSLALAFLFGKRGNRQSHAGDSGDQDHLAGHGQTSNVFVLVNQNNAPLWGSAPVRQVNPAARRLHPSHQTHHPPLPLSAIQEWLSFCTRRVS